MHVTSERTLDGGTVERDFTLEGIDPVWSGQPYRSALGSRSGRPVVISHDGAYVFPIRSDDAAHEIAAAGGTAWLRDGSSIELRNPVLGAAVMVNGTAEFSDSPRTNAGDDVVTVMHVTASRGREATWQQLGEVGAVRSPSYAGVFGAGPAWQLVSSPGAWVCKVETLQVMRTSHEQRRVDGTFGFGTLPKRADWLSGVLRVGRGTPAPRELNSPDFVWPEECLLEVRQGRVVRRF